MSRRARALLLCGCLCVSALHVPRAARAAQAGWRGPYAGQIGTDGNGEDALRVGLAERTPRDAESLARASALALGASGGPGGGM